jgi:hypothetical protein
MRSREGAPSCRRSRSVCFCREKVRGSSIGFITIEVQLLINSRYAKAIKVLPDADTLVLLIMTFQGGIKLCCFAILEHNCEKIFFH